MYNFITVWLTVPTTPPGKFQLLQKLVIENTFFFQWWSSYIEKFIWIQSYYILSKNKQYKWQINRI